MTSSSDEKNPGLPFEGGEDLSDADRIFKKIKADDKQAREVKEGKLLDDYDLVRLKAPVYVEDQELAKERRAKALAAARSADYREKKKAESGLILAMTPIDIAAKVKELGGWPQWLETQKTTVVKEVQVIKEVPVTKEVEKVVYQDRIVQVETIKEVPVFNERIVQIEVPGPLRTVEKTLEKPVIKLTAEQKKTYEIGKKLQELTGFRRKMVLFFGGF